MASPARSSAGPSPGPATPSLSPNAAEHTLPAFFIPAAARPRVQVTIRPPPAPQPVLTTPEIRKTIVCKFWLQGYCHRGESCFYTHEDGGAAEKGKEKAEELSCAICFEVPQKFGLLDTCSHIFCFTCIRGWRESKKEDRAKDKCEETDCPLCRAAASFITPSSRYFAQGPDKDNFTKLFKDRMKLKPCKYLAKSLAEEKLHCPFRNDCYYSHVLPLTGETFVFPPRPPPRPRREIASSRFTREIERVLRGSSDDEIMALELILRRMLIYDEMAFDGFASDEDHTGSDEDSDEEWD